VKGKWAENQFTEWKKEGWKIYINETWTRRGYG